MADTTKATEPTKNEPTKKELAMVALGTLATVALAAARLAPLLVAQKVTFPPEAFLEPDKVRDVADMLWQGDEEAFILDAWQVVGENLEYEPIASDIDVVNGLITCDKCYTVKETINRGMGNCVSKSALLASILLNRLEPDRVYMDIGNYKKDGVGGHAWVEVERGGSLYTIESTGTPPPNPWATSKAVEQFYLPKARISVDGIECRDNSFCLQVSDCDCGRRIAELSWLERSIR